MKQNKLLLITYYWAPAGGVAVLRWLQMSQYFANLGWQVTVFHPQNASYPSIDEKGTENIHPAIKQISLPIIEPGGLYKKFNPKQKANNTQIFKDNKGFVKSMALKLRANYFIPDARMLWIKPSVKFLTKHLKENHYDVVITNGTPHSCHIIGLGLKKKYPQLNWVADFRDPWLEIDYFEDLPLSKTAREKHQTLEHEVLSTANVITTVSASWAKLFKQKGAQKTAVFTNGFNIEPTKNPTHKKGKPLLISHVGTLDADRYPEKLFTALKQTKHIHLKLVGPIAESVQRNAHNISNIDVNAVTVAHHKAIDLMKNSDALLLLNNQKGAVEGRIPAKVFEYLALGKPIVYIGSLKNDAVRILKASEMAKFYRYEDDINIEELTTWLAQSHQTNHDFIAKYSRKNIAEQYSNFLLKTFSL